MGRPGQSVDRQGTREVGEVTDNEELEAEGRTQQTEGKVQEAWGKTKERAKEIKDRILRG